MIAYFAMRASPARTVGLRILALACGVGVVGGASAQYRYLILDAPVDKPQAIDPETLQRQGESITYAVPELADDGVGAEWVLDAPPPKREPGPPPSDDPYAPRFEHSLPWPDVLDSRPAGPQSVRRPQPGPDPDTSYSLTPQAAPNAPQVLDLPEPSSEYDGPAASWQLPEPAMLSYAPPAAPRGDVLSVVVDRQLRGTAPLRLSPRGAPMLSVQTLENLRLPVPADALDRGFATPDDLAQSYAHAFDASGQILVLSSLAPPAFDAVSDAEIWAPASAAPPVAEPLGAQPQPAAAANCAPQMRRGRNTRDCR